MGTRSVIVITGPAVYNQRETVRLYKHWDGYPTGNLPIIAEALETAAKAIEWDSKNGYGSIKPTPLTTAALAAWTVAASTTLSGPGARVEFESPEPFAPSMLGDQGDLEWIYVIDLDAKTVKTYDAQGCSPQEAYARGPVNPYNWLTRIRSEYYADSHKCIEETIQRFKRCGYAIKSPEEPFLEWNPPAHKFD